MTTQMTSASGLARNRIQWKHLELEQIKPSDLRGVEKELRAVRIEAELRNGDEACVPLRELSSMNLES